MPDTGPPYNLEYEALAAGEELGRTLHGSTTGTSPILAEQVHTQLARIEGDVVGDILARLAAAESAVAATRWRHINEGTQVGGTDFSIAVPAGYSRLRLSLVGDLSAQGAVNLRINGDTNTIYIRGFLGWDATGALDFAEFNGATSSWKVAEWSSVESNTSIVDIFPTDGTQNPSIQAHSAQVATGDTTHRHESAWGKYAGDVVVSSLNLFPGVVNWATVRWWLEGYLSP